MALSHMKVGVGTHGTKSKELKMRRRWMWAMILAVPAMQIPTAVQAFECPTHFAEVEMLITEAKGVVMRMNGGQKLVVLSDIREAKMTLREAMYHHVKSDDYHHSRAIIRANEARGYILAALALTRGHTD